MERPRPRIVTTVLKRNNKAGRLIPPSVKTYHIAAVTKTARTGERRDRWDGIQSLEVDPHGYIQLIFFFTKAI